MKAIRQAFKTAIVDLARSNESAALANSLTSLATARHTQPSSVFRLQLLECIQPTNPLGDSSDLPEIDLLVVAARKDFITLPWAISYAHQFSENPIKTTTVVTPSWDVDNLPHFDVAVAIKADEECLSNDLLLAVNNNHPPERRGWILQQAITFSELRDSGVSGVLVMDADTLLLRKRAFLAPDSRQLLMVPNRYHEEYERHASRVWGQRSRYHGLSFVTHHQLMQPRIVREMFNDEEELCRWVATGDMAQKSPISEYHSYGRWLTENYPELSILGRWGNFAPRYHSGDDSDIRASVEEVSVENIPPLSISFHHYRKR